MIHFQQISSGKSRQVGILNGHCHTDFSSGPLGLLSSSGHGVISMAPTVPGDAGERTHCAQGSLREQSQPPAALAPWSPGPLALHGSALCIVPVPCAPTELMPWLFLNHHKVAD